MNTETIVLGSGTIYAVPYTGTIPADETLEVSANVLGKVQSGCNIELKFTELPVKSDDLGINKRFAIDAELTLKANLVTWDTETVSLMSPVGSYADGVLKIGGVGAVEIPKYVVRFIPTGDADPFTMVATPSNGFALAFANDKETVLPVEFKGIAYLSDGTQATWGA